MTTEPAPTRLAPLALWRVAQAFLGVLHTLFGAPEDLAARHTLTGEAHKLIASWIRCGEAMLRRLLAIEAAAYPKPNTRPLLRPQRVRKRKPIAFTADTPEQWRVSFRCFLDRRRLAGDRRRRGKSLAGEDAGGPRQRISREDRWSSDNWKPAKFHSAWPLAERYEALIRVFNNPAPYARRLAARLHATPHRLHEALRAPPEAPHRVESFDLMGEDAEVAWGRRFSSA